MISVLALLVVRCGAARSTSTDHITIMELGLELGPELGVGVMVRDKKVYIISSENFHPKSKQSSSDFVKTHQNIHLQRSLPAGFELRFHSVAIETFACESQNNDHRG